MDHAVSLAHSAQCLKKAIPLMVKYRMPVTPINYAIWYCYVQGSKPALNAELDHVIAEQQTCTQNKAKEIFDKHLSEDDLVFFQEMADRFHGTMEQVQHDISVTLNHSKSFTTSLVDSQNELASLANVNSFNEILGCVERLTDESVAMQDYAREFQTKLAVAYNEIKDLKEALNLSQEAADTDPLTGFFNRRKFDDDIQQFCQTYSEQADESVLAVLIMFDIDHFKRFNDDFGHQKGDEVLKLVAKKVSKNISDSLNVYRYGGEEFCITGYFDSINEIMVFADKIRLDIASLTIRKKDDVNSKRAISASFGLAILRPFTKGSVLIERADRALYIAKTHGRNRIEIAPDI
ncbi:MULTISPECIES: GGDEF domain-containing protein [unclassified Pseudoalteromonas]|uniref:GGDEF domain-containing protein n=1 Tax=unclassified Pseudoalteromonas TaxID=194690 RepID=UPI0025799FB0|nr:MULTISPECIES: GGDEF domain-containing protein [unclassified Pseudoalteromonas]|tara:strand:- start:9040 stop:10086 length:1047 start_codon:yes stop_codon:yes gene_type:complete